MTLFVMERTEPTRRRKLFSILGVDYVATAVAWINVPLMIGAGIVIALLFTPVDSIPAEIAVGIGYGGLLMLSMFCHGLGHIVSSRFVNAPMDALLATATVYVTLYDDNVEFPRRIHVIRALGGPLLNLLIGLIALALYFSVVQSHFVLFFGIVNLFFVAFTLVPIPTLDGAIIFARKTS